MAAAALPQVHHLTCFHCSGPAPHLLKMFKLTSVAPSRQPCLQGMHRQLAQQATACNSVTTRLSERRPAGPGAAASKSTALCLQQRAHCLPKPSIGQTRLSPVSLTNCGWKAHGQCAALLKGHTSFTQNSKISYAWPTDAPFPRALHRPAC